MKCGTPERKSLTAMTVRIAVETLYGLYGVFAGKRWWVNSPLHWHWQPLAGIEELAGGTEAGW